MLALPLSGELVLARKGDFVKIGKSMYKVERVTAGAYSTVATLRERLPLKKR